MMQTFFYFIQHVIDECNYFFQTTRLLTATPDTIQLDFTLLSPVIDFLEFKVLSRLMIPVRFIPVLVNNIVLH